MVKSKLLIQFKELKAFFFERNESFQLDRYGIDITKMISCEQIHGNKIAVVDSIRNRDYSGCDGLLTGRKLYLNIRTADCLPIFFYDPRMKMIAAVHAGWKGLLSGIIDNTIVNMKKLGCQAKNMFISIGPHIKVCCYSVPRERWNQFQKHLNSNLNTGERRGSFWYLDLEKVALMSLLGQGLLKDHIEILPYCTSCDSRFFSSRRDGVGTGRMLNTLGLVSEND